MIPYQDLVQALTDWRVRQGLPISAGSFLAPTESSVDLALPTTSEQEILDGDDFAEVDDDGANADTAYGANGGGYGAIPDSDPPTYDEDTQFGGMAVASDLDQSVDAVLEETSESAQEILTEEFDVVEEVVEDEATRVGGDFAGIDSEQTAIGVGGHAPSPGRANDDDRD